MIFKYVSWAKLLFMKSFNERGFDDTISLGRNGTFCGVNIALLTHKSWIEKKVEDPIWVPFFKVQKAYLLKI